MSSSRSYSMRTRDSAIHCRTTPCTVTCFPERHTESARSHMSSSRARPHRSSACSGDPAGTQSGLRNGGTPAIVPDQVARGHADVVELQLGVPAVLIVSHLNAVMPRLSPGRGVARHQDLRLLPVPILAGVGLSQDDEDPGVVVHRCGDPPLATVRHVLVAVALDQRGTLVAPEEATSGAVRRTPIGSPRRRRTSPAPPYCPCLVRRS